MINKIALVILLLFFGFLAYRSVQPGQVPEEELTFEGAYKYVCTGTGGVWAYPCPNCPEGSQCKPCAGPCDCGEGKEFDYRNGCVAAAALAPLREPPLPPDDGGAPGTEVECAVGGCYNVFCADKSTIERITPSCTAELPEYDCYKMISCGPVAGKCGWLETPDFEACVARARGADVGNLPPIPQ